MSKLKRDKWKIKGKSKKNTKISENCNKCIDFCRQVV